MQDVLEIYEEGWKKYSQMVIKTWDKQILFSSGNAGYVISVAPNIVFECVLFTDDYKEESDRSLYFNLYWALIHGDIAWNRHKKTNEDHDIIEKAIKLKYDGNGLMYFSGADICIPDDYLRNEGDEIQLMCTAVYDSGELVSAYDWRRENKTLRKKYQKKMTKGFIVGIKILKEYFPDSDWD